MKRDNLFVVVFLFFVVLGTSSCITVVPDEAGDMVKPDIDWAGFLGKHDIIWETLPQRFDHGIYHGNGLLGCMIYQDAPNRLRWEMGRSDVTEHRRDNNRLPIGGMGLETVGKILDGNARLDLWNAESTGEIRTEKGVIKFRTLIHTKDMFTVVEIDCSDGEKDAKFVWLAAPAVDAVNSKFNDPPNPPSRDDKDGDVLFCVQPRYAGGEFVTAWKEVAVKDHDRRIYISIADSYPENTAAAVAIQAVRKASSEDIDHLVNVHRKWWHDYYPKSFLSVPDMKIEGFYWIQMYKLACATRSDKMVMDLLGPWFRNTGWPRIWWNLNIQICYLPVYSANHLELGESLVALFDNKRANFEKNAKDIYGFDNCATVPHTTDYEGLRGDGSRAPANFINPGDFTWALHNYWLQYRYSMDESIVNDQDKHAFYPLLKGSVNLYLKLLEKGDDGKMHLPKMHSPEYGNARDNNYNLSLLRWACITLLDLNQRYNLKDDQAPEWENVLENLVEYPTDDTGLRIGSDMAFEKSHRHWSHILMVWPLHIMDTDFSGNRALVEKTLDHWLTVGGGGGINGWSRAAASCLYSTMGDGEKALFNLNKHLSDKRFTMPNAMYIEGSPVIECAFVAAKSLQDMLIQSWGSQESGIRGRKSGAIGYISNIRIFPAVPAEWSDAVFHDMRAEGAFLVSAERKNGKTRWIRVKSLAGEPCRIVPGLHGEVRVMGCEREDVLKHAGNGHYELKLGRGEEVLLFGDGDIPAVDVSPVHAEPEACNVWGLKLSRKLSSVLSTGKQVKASSEWSSEYNAGKAFDGDEGTRWGAAPGSRSGWLEVDLGSEVMVGSVEMIETFQRTQDFAIEYKNGDQWVEILRGTTIGPDNNIKFKPLKARYVRLNILKANEVPTFEEFRVLAP